MIALAVSLTIVITSGVVAIFALGVVSQWIKSRRVRPPNRCPDCQKRAVSEAAAQAKAGLAAWKQTIRREPESGRATKDDVRQYPERKQDDDSGD